MKILLKTVLLAAAMSLSFTSCSVLSGFMDIFSSDSGSSSGDSSGGSSSDGSGSSGGSTGTTETSSGTSSTAAGTELSWSDWLSYDKSYFSNFAAGSEIRVTATKTGNGGHVLKMYTPVENQGWIQLSNGTLSQAVRNSNGEISPSQDSGTFIYAVTAEEAERLRNYGMLLHGEGLAVSNVETYTSGNANTAGSSSSSGTVLPIAGKALSWSDTLSFDKSYFSNFAGGSQIVLSLTNTDPYSNQFKMYSPVANAGWMPLQNGTVTNASISGGVVSVPQSGTVVYTVSQQEADYLKNYGMLLHGGGVTVNKIEVIGTDGTAGSVSNGASAVVPAGGTPYSRHGALTVRGNGLIDKYGSSVQLYGMSTHGLSWFGNYVDKDGFQTLRDDWQTNCVRLVLYPRDYNGYLTGGNQSQLKELVYKGIDSATALGMYVIVDWHVHNYNPAETQNEAIAFFRDVSARYRGSDNVLYEICNEPVGSDWNSVIKPYAEAVIPVIRANDSNAVIIVGTNTWSQDIEGPMGNPLGYSNVMYSFHFYANTHTDSMRSRVENALRAGMPIFVTEFGTCDASGNGGFNTYQSQLWFNLLKQYNISHINWSLCNKGETASAIAPWCTKTSGWAESDLSDSGKLVRNHFRSLPQ